MNQSDVITASRNLLDDRVKPYLWSDDELSLFADIAYPDAVTRVHGNTDSLDGYICNINIKIGVSSYELDKAILQIIRAKLSGENNPLTQSSVRDLDKYFTGWESTTGTPRFFIGDMDTHYIQLYPTPEVDDTLTLTVKRLPDNLLSVSGGEMEFLPNRFHYGVVFLVCSLANMKQDADTFNSERSVYFEGQATNVLGPKKSANTQVFEREFQQKQVRINSF